jgi:hypothetical protein
MIYATRINHVFFSSVNFDDPDYFDWQLASRIFFLAPARGTCIMRCLSQAIFVLWWHTGPLAGSISRCARQLDHWP